MAQTGSLKLKLNLIKGSISPGNVETEHELQLGCVRPVSRDGAGSDRPSSHSSTTPSSRCPSEDRSRPPSRKVEPEDETSGTVNIPTATAKSRKRKQINTDFEAATLSKNALSAQEEERKRLERLKQTRTSNGNGVGDHIAQVAALHPTLPVIDVIDLDELLNGYPEEKPSTICAQGPSTSRQPEIIDLSSDEDEIQEIGYFPGRPQLPKFSFGNDSRTSYKRDNNVEMTRQHRIEQQRLKLMRVRLGKDELEAKDMSNGRLLVNSGHPPEEPDVEVPNHLTWVLQPHQLGGIRFMYDNIVQSVSEYQSSPGFGCILAHSMGLGKTLQVVTFTDIFFRATKAHKVLIIVPVNTIQNWKNEFDKWIPEKYNDQRIRKFNVHLLGDTVRTYDQRVRLLEDWHTCGGVLLIGYDMFRQLIASTQPPKKKPTRPHLNFLNGKRVREAERKEKEFVPKESHEKIRSALLDPGPDLVVCDEGHKIKNLTTAIAAALTSIRTRRRIVLTGYPLQNNLMEYYCMVDFVRPEYLDTKKSFSMMFEKPIKNGHCIDSTPSDYKLALQRTHVLVEMLKGFVQRRTHHLLKTILPQNTEYVLLLRKSPIQHALYRNFLHYAQGEICSGSSTFNPLKAFAACSKIWNHPDILAKQLDRLRDMKMKDSQVRMNMMDDSKIGLFPSHNSNFGLHPSSSMPNLGQLLNGQMEWRDPDLDIMDDDEFGEKKKKAVRSKVCGLMTDLDIRGLRYDWADMAMQAYRKGDIEQGYKMSLTLDLLDETTKIGEKMLIFSQNLAALDLIEEFLSRRKVVLADGNGDPWQKNKNYCRLDGSTAGIERERLVNKFNGDPNLKLFLISTKAGSLGINLRFRRLLNEFQQTLVMRA